MSMQSFSEVAGESAPPKQRSKLRKIRFGIQEIGDLSQEEFPRKCA